MEIVVEYILVDNIIINYLIILLSKKILKLQITVWKAVLSSVIGATFALLLPIMILPTYILLPLKFILGFLMVLIAFPYSNLKKTLTYFLVFILMTGLMGGVCFVVIYMFSGNLSTNMLFYSAPIPIGLILLICSVTTYFVSSLIKLFYRKKRENNFIYEAIIINNGKKVKINAFLDSGNTLIDPVSKKPVIIISYPLFNKLYNLPLEQIIMKKVTSENIKNSHYISFDTVGKSSCMLVFEIEEIKILISKAQVRSIENVLLGLSFANISKIFYCDALLHPDYVYC